MNKRLKAKLEKRGYAVITASHYVATYGDMGLEVELFDNALTYARAVKAVQAEYDAGNIDSYTNGDTTITRKVAA